MKFFLKIVLWFIIAICMINTGFSMLSASNTMENILGFLIIVAICIITAKTECLTNLNFKRKHEK